tara:strand:- start:20 stop:397 length:378 start_codon:yes stop_codon:yes gene_type:complete
LDIQVSVSDQNLPTSHYLSFLLPTGERVVDQKSYSFDVSDLNEGKYSIEVSVQDMAKNNALSRIIFEIDHSVIDPPKTSSISTSSPEITESDENYLLIIIIGIIAIAIVSVLVILNQKSKIIQKN